MKEEEGSIAYFQKSDSGFVGLEKRKDEGKCPDGSRIKFSLGELMPWKIGQGSERLCFRSPLEPSTVIKISPADNAKQTLREIQYFHYLQKRKVPFLHLPKFKGMVEVEGYIGFAQELILDKDGEPAPSLGRYLMEKEGDMSDRFAKLAGWLQALYRYLEQYNVIPCDLGLTNILVDEREEGGKLVLVDGLGPTEWIPLASYCPFFGRKSIHRKWYRFLRRSGLPVVDD